MDSRLGGTMDSGPFGDSTSFLAGGGQMGALMRAKDWSQSPLGAPGAWPQSLKTVVRIMLTSRYAMWMAWGGELSFFYNDAYRPTLGVKHPQALGMPAQKVWAEIWQDIGPRIEAVLDRGEATWEQALLLFLERSGYREETYHTFSYSPLADDTGRVAGMLCVVTEETERVIGERRLGTLRELSAELAGTHRREEVLAAVTRSLGANPRDLPFTLTYLLDGDGTQARLGGSTGLDGHPAAAAPMLDIARADCPWPMAGLAASTSPIIVTDLPSGLAGLAAGAWGEPPAQAAVVPVARRGQDKSAGFLVVGLNPYRRFDDSYGGFLTLVAGQIASGIANAAAYEDERKRAEALAELDRAKTAFFSNVSHEFRTPLTLMLSPLEELLAKADQADGAQRRGLVEVAHRNALRLLKLVNMLLDFSRIEAGRTKASYQPTDLAAFTAELASSFRSAMDGAGLRFVIACPPLDQPVYVDRDMWEKLVLNLISNAFKFTLSGEIRIELAATRDGAVELTVRDTGVGIPAHELDRVFERFHRIEGQPSRSFEGSGIGLALVQELVKLHGGSIRVESEPTRGTAFHVRIPLGTAHLPPEAIGAGRNPASPTRSQAYVEEAMRWLPDDPRQNLRADLPDGIEPAAAAAAATAAVPPAPAMGRVLLVDDNADLRSYVGRLLAERGYEVALATDGEAALCAARERMPDLILSDVMMPRLDGFGLLRAIRADAELRAIPVVLLSARAGEEARVEGLDAGADDYLIKPFSARELLARVSTNLAIAQARSAERQRLREDGRTLEILNRIGATVAAELDLDRAVQTVTDAATELSGAAFGAFFYNVLDEHGEKYTLYTLSGTPRAAFADFPMPRNTAVFAPTFHGEGVVRSDDITKDPRYGQNAPYFGKPKGHLPVCSYLAAPVISRSGEVLGGLFFGHPQPGVFTDRSERLVVGIASQAAIALDNAKLYRTLRDREEAMARLNAGLEKRVEERTAELAAANRQLLKQIEERERVEATLRQMQRLEAVGQLTSGVAHDFNNLLTVVLGNIGFLEKGLNGADPKAAQRLSFMRTAAERGAKLTSQLLAFSRRQRLEPKPINLNEAVQSMRDLLESTMGGSVQIETLLRQDLWTALVDPTQIELVVLNLAINARDAMQVGGRLTVETANVTLGPARRPEEPPAGDYVMIAVGDTGHGMPPDVLAKCLEPFFTTKDIGKGSGLGLSQVLGFAQQSGGGVRIDTRVDEGTTVRVYLPRATAPSRAPLVGEPATPLAEPLNEACGILLVDDDHGVREVTASMLQEMGHAVLEAGSGGHALELLEQQPNIELMLIDFAMPGMNGAELARQVRAKRPGLPMIFLTGYADTTALGDIDEDHIIRKPFRDSDLVAKIRHVLETQSPAD
jgi:signal transduction histidine kinase/CheY-like chemotaxis protein